MSWNATWHLSLFPPWNVVIKIYDKVDRKLILVFIYPQFPYSWTSTRILSMLRIYIHIFVKVLQIKLAKLSNLLKLELSYKNIPHILIVYTLQMSVWWKVSFYNDKIQGILRFRVSHHLMLTQTDHTVASHIQLRHKLVTVHPDSPLCYLRRSWLKQHCLRH